LKLISDWTICRLRSQT